MDGDFGGDDRTEVVAGLLTGDDCILVGLEIVAEGCGFEGEARCFVELVAARGPLVICPAVAPAVLIRART